ncbi:MAG TPA: nicotinate-nucleotide adenylyltransferase [Candidatus Binataceae bacterium]|jgi:nicotinate-nucleotide adenylyltransferase|nr:nicotinate-nucleotide adenylyltransferase [Candidatus Binataceae bacterium]
MRVGLYGGSFNPIHFGHLRAAEEVREALKLDLIYFIPAASPPHKTGGDLAPSDHRLKMVQLGTKGNRHFMVSEVEIRRSGPSYTIDTLRHFIATMRGGPQFHLLLGGDQFVEFDTWKECAELMRLSNLVVHTRPEENRETFKVSLAALDRFGYVKKDDHYVHQSSNTLSFVATTFLPISATLIRRKIAAHESIRYLLPADVADYIERHNLY